MTDMKRDPNLIRDLMIFIELHQPGEIIGTSELMKRFPSTDEFVLADHVQQLREAKFIEAAPVITDKRARQRQLKPKIIIHRITSIGHDFLSAARDNRKWDGFTRTVVDAGIVWTVTSMLEFLMKN